MDDENITKGRKVAIVGLGCNSICSNYDEMNDIKIEIIVDNKLELEELKELAKILDDPREYLSSTPKRKNKSWKKARFYE